MSENNDPLLTEKDFIAVTGDEFIYGEIRYLKEYLDYYVRFGEYDYELSKAIFLPQCLGYVWYEDGYEIVKNACVLYRDSHGALSDTYYKMSTKEICKSVKFVNPMYKRDTRNTVV